MTNDDNTRKQERSGTYNPQTHTLAHSHALAYRVMATLPSRYVVEPAKGTLQARSSVHVCVRLRGAAVPVNERLRDKLQVEVSDTLLYNGIWCLYV
jgi:hypothetical protein